MTRYNHQQELEKQSRDASQTFVAATEQHIPNRNNRRQLASDEVVPVEFNAETTLKVAKNRKREQYEAASDLPGRRSVQKRSRVSGGGILSRRQYEERRDKLYPQLTPQLHANQVSGSSRMDAGEEHARRLIEFGEHRYDRTRPLPVAEWEQKFRKGELIRYNDKYGPGYNPLLPGDRNTQEAVPIEDVLLPGNENTNDRALVPQTAINITAALQAGTPSAATGTRIIFRVIMALLEPRLATFMRGGAEQFAGAFEGPASALTRVAFHASIPYAQHGAFQLAERIAQGLGLGGLVLDARGARNLEQYFPGAVDPFINQGVHGIFGGISRVAGDIAAFGVKLAAPEILRAAEEAVDTLMNTLPQTLERHGIRPPQQPNAIEGLDSTFEEKYETDNDQPRMPLQIPPSGGPPAPGDPDVPAPAPGVRQPYAILPGQYLGPQQPSEAIRNLKRVTVPRRLPGQGRRPPASVAVGPLGRQRLVSIPTIRRTSILPARAGPKQHNTNLYGNVVRESLQGSRPSLDVLRRLLL